MVGNDSTTGQWVRVSPMQVRGGMKCSAAWWNSIEMVTMAWWSCRRRKGDGETAS
ncbi:uncharacterized protein BCR38DRAFT_123661 [Pseudomassariella vexata]|uniref:Uncharacterized protein n=1 Tax=Pseudomassariella vexata TaxID=1141098 RepID=A0A1Y2D994_9PEZI|nr:uncharacterized protein BCR38DRAFT_123661 [Pseudomassariella vexata]ORY55696.1 hypothetical protein BCR38DRAFT_123661 [Pseudomassariella vexata]